MQNLLKKPTRAASRRKKSVQPVAEPVLKLDPLPISPELEKNKPFRSARSFKHSPHLPALEGEQLERSIPASFHFKFPKRYVSHLPTLLLSLLFGGLLVYLLSHFYPPQLANIFIPQLYFPVTGAFFVSCFFGLSYLFLHTRRGLHWALCLTILLWLKLQLVLTLPVALIILAPFLVIELFLTASHQ